MAERRKDDMKDDGVVDEKSEGASKAPSESAEGSVGPQAPRGRTVKRTAPGGLEHKVEEGLGTGQAPSPGLLPAQYDNDGLDDVPAQSR
jgi:hypothetical protein